ncbi:MAG: type II toxin-antitoxin system RelE/ParE family toxin [Campylobacterota bacterium]
MTIIHKPTFSKQLKEILEYIAQDKPSASMKFKNDLKESINLLPSNPIMYRESIYFNDKNIRDMIHKGYTIIYRIRPIKQEIEILRIFNKNKPSQ